MFADFVQEKCLFHGNNNQKQLLPKQVGQLCVLAPPNNASYQKVYRAKNGVARSNTPNWAQPNRIKDFILRI